MPVESTTVNSDWNFAGLDLFPAYNSGTIINAAAEKEDNMAFINLDMMDTDSVF